MGALEKVMKEKYECGGKQGCKRQYFPPNPVICMQHIIYEYEQWKLVMYGVLVGIKRRDAEISKDIQEIWYE